MLEYFKTVIYIVKNHTEPTGTQLKAIRNQVENQPWNFQKSMRKARQKAAKWPSKISRAKGKGAVLEGPGHPQNPIWRGTRSGPDLLN